MNDVILASLPELKFGRSITHENWKNVKPKKTRLVLLVSSGPEIKPRDSVWIYAAGIYSVGHDRIVAKYIGKLYSPANWYPKGSEDAVQRAQVELLTGVRGAPPGTDLSNILIDEEAVNMLRERYPKPARVILGERFTPHYDPIPKSKI